MDINVKNELDYLMNTCSRITTEDGRTFRDVLARDVYGFICNISKSGSEERFNLFSKLYLDGAFKAKDFTDVITSGQPESVKLITSIEAKSNGKMAAMTSKQLVAFFTTLGRSYMSSAYDRKIIDTTKFIDLIQDMNSFVDTNVPVKITKAASTNAKPALEQSDLSDSETSSVESGEQEEPVEPEETLEELLEQLDSLIGLQEVKSEVNGIINMIKVKKKGEELGVKQPPLSLHLVFYGNPGTGKTTVARLLAKIYRSLGVLSKGQLVEVDRGGLVAGYVGQTAEKTKKAIEEAMGGILFIDEAYTLTHGKGDNDFGQEAVDTILKAMEDHRDDFIVIVAGYPELMKEFVASNPGLKSRFNQYINFSDYSPEELYQIFRLYCQKQELTYNKECSEFLKRYFDNLYANRSDDYANGRDVRNYFEHVIKARANRLAESNLEEMTREEFLTIELPDLETATKETKSI